MQPSYLASEGRPNLFTRVLLSIMLIVLAIFPFGMGVIRIAQGYVGKMTMISLSVMALIVGLILSLCAVTMLMAGKKMSKSQVWFVSLGLFVLSMVIRVLSSYLLQTQPISDFNICYQFALGNPPEGEALGIFPYLGAYALVLKSLFNILPKAVLTAQVFNAAVLSLVPVFLFLGIRKCMGNDRPAIASAMMYALYPSAIIYSSVLSCENVAQMFVALFIMVHAYWTSAEPGTKKKYGLSIVMGVVLGFLNTFKPILPLFVGAVAMACFCYQIIPATRALLHRVDGAKRRVLELIGHMLIIIIVAMIVYNVSVYVIQRDTIGDPSQEEGHSLGSLLYCGLNPDTNGVWNAGVIETIHEVRDQYPEEASRVLLQKLMDMYQGDISLLVSVITNKHYTDWCQESVYYYWTFGNEDSVVQGTIIGSHLFENIPNLYAIALYALCVLGLVIMLIRMFLNTSWNYAKNQDVFVCVGVVFLFVLMLIFIEAQGRYKSNIMPLMCWMGGIGMWMTLDCLSKGLTIMHQTVKSRILSRQRMVKNANA